MKYGPWIAFNKGDTPPADGVMVQAQGNNEARFDIDDGDFAPSRYFAWGNIIAYRVVTQPVRGEAVYDGVLRSYHSLHPNRGSSCYDMDHDHVHVTFSTDDGLLIPGTYTGPDGATIKIEALK